MGGRRPVVFDLDGVLIDSEPLYEQAFRAYVASVPSDEVTRLFALTIGRRDADFIPEIAARFGQEPADVAAGLAEALEPLLADLAPMPGAAEVVESLRADGRLLALATSSLAGFAARALDGLGLAGAFDAAVTGDEVGAGKPDPEIYALAASRLGVEPAACVAIEDTPAGVAAATAAGMTCIAVPHPLANRSGLAGADVVADDLHTAAAEIRRLDAARV